MNAQSIHAENKQILVADLENTFEKDQATRAVYNQCVKEHGSASAACKALREAMVNQDSVNQEIVFGILDKYGWLPSGVISEKAGKAFFYVIQHAQLEAQLKYASLIDTAFKRGEISAVEYAYFIDRLKSKQGQAQLYGTQNAIDNLGNSYVYPVKDWAVADSLRKAMNESSLEEYLQQSQLSNKNLPQTDFRKHAIVIGHIWEDNNKAVDKVSVTIGEEKIGQSDHNGFFFLEIERTAANGGVLILEKEGFKKVNYSLKGDKDFYEIYVMLR